MIYETFMQAPIFWKPLNYKLYGNQKKLTLLFLARKFFLWYTIIIHPRSKSTRVQNPPIFFYFLYFLTYFIYFWIFKFIFYLLFSVIITHNPYPRSVSGSQVWLGGFWMRKDLERVPFYILKYTLKTNCAQFKTI